MCGNCPSPLSEYDEPIVRHIKNDVAEIAALSKKKDKEIIEKPNETKKKRKIQDDIREKCKGARAVADEYLAKQKKRRK